MWSWGLNIPVKECSPKRARATPPHTYPLLCHGIIYMPTQVTLKSPKRVGMCHSFLNHFNREKSFSISQFYEVYFMRYIFGLKCNRQIGFQASLIGSKKCLMDVESRNQPKENTRMTIHLKTWNIWMHFTLFLKYGSKKCSTLP